MSQAKTAIAAIQMPWHVIRTAQTLLLFIRHIDNLNQIMLCIQLSDNRGTFISDVCHCTVLHYTETLKPVDHCMGT